MQVHYDHQIFSRQRFGGISQYFSRLMSAIAQEPDVSVACGARFHVNEHLAPAFGRVKLPPFRGVRRACDLLNEILPARRGAALVHSTFYDTKFLRSRAAVPMVATVHDMIPEIYADMIGFNPHAGKLDYVRAARRVICISECTRADLVRLYRVPEDKIDVVHHGVDLAQARRDLAPVAAPEAFLLYVGQRAAYKNFTVLLEAMVALWAKGAEISLVCVGGGAFTAQELAMAGAHRARLLHLVVDDRQVRSLMSKASALVMTSLYEGFGLPIIEAMALDCPLVLARASCFPDIAQDAARYFDPHDPLDLARALEPVIEDRETRAALSAAAARLAPRYSSAAMAQATLATYRAAL